MIKMLIDWFNENYILGTIVLLAIIAIIAIIVDKATFLDDEEDK